MVLRDFWPAFWKSVQETSELRITDVIDTKGAALSEFNKTQVREGVDPEKLRKLFADRVDGNAGYTHGFGYAEQFVRLNVEKGRYLPLA